MLPSEDSRHRRIHSYKCVGNKYRKADVGEIHFSSSNNEASSSCRIQTEFQEWQRFCDWTVTETSCKSVHDRLTTNCTESL